MRLLALLLTTLTGFSGLVYEVTWQKYLATLLGSHSEATAAVLGIFLGGLSLGYWLFGAQTHRLVRRAEATGQTPRLLWVYGLLEAAIGAYALAFPFLFEGVSAISYAIPHGIGGLGFAFDVGLAALLIGPPTIAMGATIPILTQALSRGVEDATRLHALVYAFNTIGAFLGALAAAFFLIPALGLVNVMFAMGAANLTAGGIFLILGGKRRATALVPSSRAELSPTVFAPYAAVALLTGFAMMTVQTTVIRIGALAFGSSEHTFATVVAVFVLCIAIGSFSVSAVTRIRHAVLPISLWSLVVLLCLVYARLPEAPYWIHVVRSWFRDDPSGFYPFHFLGFLCILVMIGPAVLVSGALLPLIFDHLRRRLDALGEVAGRLYGWNTLGSLLGALLGGYVLFFWLDLDQIFRIAIAAVGLAATILSLVLYGRGRTLVSLVTVLLVSTPLVYQSWDPELMTAGLFRQRQPIGITPLGADSIKRLIWKKDGIRIVFHEDDPTATVTVMEWGKEGAGLMRSIVSNGKSDGNTLGDLPTMVLTAVLPALFADRPERVFVVGYGTGITVGELASLESVEQIIVAEISPGVIHAAPLFDFANYAASRDPKVEIICSDAHRALMRSDGNFDLIVSEPSNPWVTGVEMLYSREFLTAAAAHLNPGGVFAQWIQQYDIDDAALELVLRTFSSVFKDVTIWRADADLILLGFNETLPPSMLDRLERRIAQPDYATSLKRAGIESLPALLIHEIVPAGVLHAAKLTGPLHTLTHPRLSHQAGLAFFLGQKANLPFTGFGKAARVGAENSLLNRLAARHGGRLSPADRKSAVGHACATHPSLCLTLLAAWQQEDPHSPQLLRILRSIKGPERSTYLATIDELLPLFPDHADTAAKRVPFVVARRATLNFRQFYHHAVGFRHEQLRDIWSRCRAGPARPEACARGMEQARQLVRTGALRPQTDRLAAR